MADEIDLDTPVVDVDVVPDEPSADGSTNPDAAKPEEPYLSVNERTVYKTKDDAVRGYNEAANRIAQLSAWEKQAKQYGLTDPKQLDQLAKEILDLRKFQADAAKQASMPKVDQADPKAKETQQVKEYLKGLGYISREDQDSSLKELRDKIAAMEQSGTAAEELRFQNQEAEAQSDLNGLLAASGIKDDAIGTKGQLLGTLVKDWVNGSEERIARWQRGGMTAKALVKEGTEAMISALGWKAAPAVAAAATQLKPTDPGYAAAKAKALAANKGKLPAPGTAKETTQRTASKQRSAIGPKQHDEAWKIFQEMESK